MLKESLSELCSLVDQLDGYHSTELSDISNNSSKDLLKAVTKSGSGIVHPFDGCIVRFSYHWSNLKLNDATNIVDKHEADNEQQCSCQLGKDRLVPALYIGLKTMVEGEEAVIYSSPEYAYGNLGLPPKIPPDAYLAFTVLLHKVEGHVIEDDKVKVVKRYVMKHGSSKSTPAPGSYVTVSYKDLTKGQTGESVKFVLGEDTECTIPHLVQIGITTMRKGETCIFLYNHLIDSNDRNEVYVKQEFEVSLEDFSQVKGLWRMTPTEKLNESERLKAKGTELFKKGEIRAARRLYRRVVDTLVEDSYSEDEQTRRRSLLLAAHLNIAISSIKLKDYIAALHASDEALKLDSTNEKGLFRRGQANLEMNNHELAGRDFAAVIEMYSSNSAAKRMLAETRRRAVVSQQKALNTYSGMFDKFVSKEKQRHKEWQRQQVRDADRLFSDVGIWSNSMAEGMLSLEQEMEAFGEQPPPRPRKSNGINHGKDDM